MPCRALRFSVIVLNSLLHISRVGFLIVMRVLGFVYDFAGIETYEGGIGLRRIVIACLKLI